MVQTAIWVNPVVVTIISKTLNTLAEAVEPCHAVVKVVKSPESLVAEADASQSINRSSVRAAGLCDALVGQDCSWQ